MKSNLAPPEVLLRTPKGCEHPRLRTPALSILSFSRNFLLNNKKNVLIYIHLIAVVFKLIKLCVHQTAKNEIGAPKGIILKSAASVRTT